MSDRARFRRILPTVWRGLRAVTRRVGEAQAWLLLTCLYFVVLGPMAIVFKGLTDPLRLRRSSGPDWHPRTDAMPSMRDAQRQ